MDLTPKGREAMVRCVVEKGLSKAAAARQFNTTPKTVANTSSILRRKLDLRSSSELARFAIVRGLV
jgi:DNA-binding NarL/FixJ family response regulator